MIHRAAVAAIATLAAACASHPAGSSDGGLDAAPQSDGAISSCAPRQVTAPAVPWIPPHALRRNVCIPQDAAAITSCFVQGQSCDVAVSASCHACAVSSDTTPSSAALIIETSGKLHELNIAGCVGALSGDPSATGCGAKLAAKNSCIASACAHCTNPADLQTCAAQAATGVCAAAAAEAQCAAPFLAQCIQGATVLEIAFNLVKLFCGP